MDSNYRLGNGLFLGVDITGTSFYYGGATNGVKQNDFQLVEMRLGYETEKYDIVLWGKNILDKEYYILFDEMPKSGVLKAVEGEPRTLEITPTSKKLF